PTTRMRRVSSYLNCILVTMMMVLGYEGRNFGLLNKAFRSSTAEIDNSCDSSTSCDVHHVENVLDDIEHKVILLLKAGRCDTYSNATVGYGWTKDRNSRLVS